MNLIVFGFSMLCALGAAIFAATPAPGWRGPQRGPHARQPRVGPERGSRVGVPWRRLGWIALGLAIAVAAVDAPDLVWISAAVVVAAMFQLLWPRDGAFAVACSGALAGVWSRLLQLGGLPFVPALILALSVPVVTSYLAARRPAFAPVPLREEALLALFGFGVLVAVAPTVSAGWRAAMALNLPGSAGSTQLLPVWVLTVSGASIALGGFYSLWMRR